MITIGKFNYSDVGTPAGYVCGGCMAKGVRLYREYNTFLDYQRLLCRECAMKDQKKTEAEFDRMNPYEHSIGWLVAAVPTEDGSGFWGYTSVPQAGCDWWDNLPKRRAKMKLKNMPKDTRKPFVIASESSFQKQWGSVAMSMEELMAIVSKACGKKVVEVAITPNGQDIEFRTKEQLTFGDIQEAKKKLGL